MSSKVSEKRTDSSLEAQDGMQMTESELLLAQLSRGKLVQLVCVLGTLAAVIFSLAVFAPPLPLPESGLHIPKSLDDIKVRCRTIEYRCVETAHADGLLHPTGMERGFGGVREGERAGSQAAVLLLIC